MAPPLFLFFAQHLLCLCIHACMCIHLQNRQHRYPVSYRNQAQDGSGDRTQDLRISCLTAGCSVAVTELSLGNLPGDWDWGQANPIPLVSSLRQQQPPPPPIPSGVPPKGSLQRAMLFLACRSWASSPRVRALIGLIRQIDLSESLAYPLAPDSPSRGSITVAGSLGGPHQRVAG